MVIVACMAVVGALAGKWDNGQNVDPAAVGISVFVALLAGAWWIKGSTKYFS